MLIGAAKTGTIAEATAALLAQDRVRLTRTLPDAILRIHTAALLIAGGGVLAVGAEGPGLSPDARRRADAVVTIQMAGAVESLNAAVAAAVVAFEWRRQRCGSKTA